MLKKAKATRKKRNPKRHTEEEKAVALEAVNLAGGNVARAARESGICESTVREWARGRNVSADVLADYAAKKTGALTSRLRVLQERLVEALFDEGKIDAARYGELNAAFGAVTDKLRLIDGAPTVITETRNDTYLRADALQLLADYKAALEGDELRALAMLAEDAPTLARYIN